TALDRGGGHSKALLDIPAAFTVADAAPRLAKLRESFPDWEKFPEQKVPEVAADDLRQAAKSSYDRLLDAGREAVLRRLKAASPNGPETPKTWLDIRPWLANPEDLSDWRKLARLLWRLGNPGQGSRDPVTDLEAFLKQDRFDL